MNIESELITREDFKRRWYRISVLNRSEDKFPIILIGKSKTPSSYNYIGNPHVVADYSEAKHQVFSIASQSYKIIVIDIALVVNQLEKFSSIAKEKTNTIIIYNAKKLTRNEAKFLKAFNLVDEVIDLELESLDFVVKNAIEAKSKNYYYGLIYKTKELHVKGKTKARDLSFFLKKVFDIFIAAVLVLLLLPLFILISIAIWYDSKGPVFYSSLRAGQGYRIFKFYKFRTMVKDADKKISELAHLNQYDLSKEGPSFFKLSDDPRITGVGSFLRNTSLDELPQLLNILLGDMSLVGNRPLPLYEAATLTTNEFVERFTAPAGMTGFWQIKKRGKAEMSVKDRVDLDIIYARKASPIFDLYIMANTPAALFQKSDA
ncbi:sugar transferase [Segetibacter sp.]|jgi:lipopolysaccharide/colanic/teichoic acid biosynthesis glycosyltransferase|uniref:sugar transferase n=1 Tax=Segetibacter sp. TaxID=2231182 RepID=UPI002612B554|nr:sugar transferase [Segetibacter sp.]MCW3081250.1 colanic biosynthesis UDP-glucose lipid carrier transferase [Segetibacter sp.]